MSSVGFVDQHVPAGVPALPDRDEDRSIAALRASVRTGGQAAVFFALCVLLLWVIGRGGQFDFSPPSSEIVRTLLGVTWLGVCALGMVRAAVGKMPPALMPAAGILVLTLGRLSFLRWDTVTLALLAGSVALGFARAQKPLVDGLPRGTRQGVACALWLALFGITLTSPADHSSTLRQLSALALSILFFLPLTTAIMERIIDTIDRVVSKGWKVENVLWLLAALLLVSNVAYKWKTGSRVHQIGLGIASIEPFEIARVIMVIAFAITAHRWKKAAGAQSVWLPSWKLLIGPFIVSLLFVLLKEKGTLALVIAAFGFVWASEVGGRTTLVMALTGLGVLTLTLVMASERLAILNGNGNYQAQASSIMSTHPGLIGAIGAARPGVFLGEAAPEDFALVIVSTQAGIVGLAMVLGVTVIMFLGLFWSLWGLRPGIPRAIGITLFIHLLLPAVTSLLSFASGVVIGLPYPFLGRGGNHLLIALAALGALVSLGAVNRGQAEKAEINAQEEKGEERWRLRAVLAVCVGMVLVSSVLALARGKTSWGSSLTEQERAELQSVPVIQPSLHWSIESADRTVLAHTVFTERGPRRSYSIDPGSASIIGAGTDRVQASGLQAWLFRNQFRLATQSRRWLFGPAEFSPSPSRASITLHSAWTGLIGEMARENGLTGAILVLRRDGAIEVALSLPGYDPNITGNQQYFERLKADVAAPMFNRAMHGVYAPASVVKGLEALMLVEAGYADAAVLCDGSRCSGVVHRDVRSVEQALAISCNLWFETQLRNFSKSHWKENLERAGLGRQEVAGIGGCGIALPNGQGSVPSAWAIGHEWTASPLSLAVAYLTVSNEGRRVRPFILEQLGEVKLNNEESDIEAFNPASSQRVLRGMRAAVYSPIGTARSILETYRGQQLLGAKTGTADTGQNKPNNALMVALTRSRVVLIIKERGGKGKSLGPLMGNILNLVE